jgi:gliding motility-associated-like protein
MLTYIIFLMMTIFKNRFTLPFSSVILIGFLVLSGNIIFSQNVVNNGDNIVINSGAFVVITGDYINETGNGDGKIDIDGTMMVDGNWINNAPSTVFTNVETVPDGYVILKGVSPQFIGGLYPTHFENLNLIRSRKTMQVTLCEVNGIMTVDAILDLNSKRIIMDNSSPTAINYVSKYILSETSPLTGYGEVQWNIGSTLNTYSIPFGSGFSNNNDLNLVLTTTTGGNPPAGNISFATYPSDCNNNELPTGVVSLDHDPKNVADRYWIINPDYTITKPDVDIVFKYNFEDVDVCNENIVQENLQAIRYNTNSLSWDDIEPIGIANKNDRTVTVTGLSKSDFYEPWTLLYEEILPMNIWFPNAFTPNHDGTNDYFGPVGLDLEKYDFTMYIFDRWGEKIYEANDINAPWNGKPTGSNTFAPLGVYTWLVILTDEYGEELRYIGRVTLIR